MSDPTTASAAAAQTAATSKTVYATLIRGRHYDYNGKVWVRDGKHTHPVSETEAKYLREKAVELVVVDGEEFHKARFKFSEKEPTAEEAAAPAPRPRARRRSSSAE